MAYQPGVLTTETTDNSCVGDLTCNSTLIHIRVTASANADAVRSERFDLTVDVPEEPFEGQVPEWKRNFGVPYKPVVRKLKDDWKCKWRLTQQRPRDGLR